MKRHQISGTPLPPGNFRRSTLKSILALAVIFISYLGCNAQTAYDYLNQNGLSARFNADGQLFWDGKKSAFEAPKGNNTHTLSAAALWLGGTDKNHINHISAQTYDVTGTDFKPGPLDSNGSTDSATSSLYNKVWKVTRLEIDSFLAGLSTPSSILNWPGNGNTAKGYSQKLAPFIDVDNDGKYNPAKGDYPDIKGDVMLWWVFNDVLKHTETNGIPLKMEVQASAYAYSCANDPLLNNAVFLHYTVTNRGTMAYDSFYAGVWTDFDIGNPFNDYVGCDTLHNAFFAYNATDNDNDTSIIRKPDTIFYKGFQNKLPAQSFNFLNGFTDDKGAFMPMSHFAYFYNTDDSTAMGFPRYQGEYLNYLEGKWRNGTSITLGSNGMLGNTPTNFAFSGDPAVADQWSERSAHTKLADRSCIGSYGPVSLQAGGVKEINAAFIFNMSGAGTTLKSLALMKDNISTLEELYKKNALTPCTGIGICSAGDTCVWPGDANNDGKASADDVFNLGYAFGAKGPARQLASSNYVAQHSASWGRTFPNGKDFKFADCNGDGVIDSADVMPIVLNYAYTHNKKGDPLAKSTDPLIYVDIIEDSVAYGSEFHVRVKLGDSSIKALNVTGLAFDLHYDQTVIDTDGFYADFSGSWIGNGGIIGITKNDHGSGTTHSGQSAMNKTGKSDSGIIIMFKYVVSDNISGGAAHKSIFDISSVLIADNNLNISSARVQPDSIKFFVPLTGIDEANLLGKSVHIYPNPAKDVLNIEFKSISPQTIKIFNVYGQEMQNITVPKDLSDSRLKIDTSILPEGIYFLQMQGHGSVATKKFIIAK